MTHNQLSAGERPFVLKEVLKYHFHDDVALHRNLPRSPFVRTLEDTAEAYSMLVYPYLKDDLLKLCATRRLPLRSTKQILKDALCGIAELHAKDFVHTGE
jgi:CRP-like cAMP-binding protein